MSTKGTYIEEEDNDILQQLDELQLEIDTNEHNIEELQIDVNKNTDDIVTLNTQVTNVTASDATLTTQMGYLGNILGLAISDWDTMGQVITIPHSTGTWFGAFNQKNLGLNVAGTYIVSLNFTTFINTGTIAHNPITIGCELFQYNVALGSPNVPLATIFSGSCGINTNNMETAPSPFNALNAVGCSMSFPVHVFDPTLPFSMSLYYFFNNNDNVDIQLLNNVPDSGDPLRWWRSNINVQPMPFTMTLVGF